MIEIQVPETIKIGGHDYKIEVCPERDQSLTEEDWNGEHSSRSHRIAVLSTLAPQLFSKVFMHEVLHGINAVYYHSKLEEEAAQSLSEGLLQVMEQLRVRFVKRT